MTFRWTQELKQGGSLLLYRPGTAQEHKGPDGISRNPPGVQSLLLARKRDWINFRARTRGKPLEEEDDDGRLPDQYKPWPELPPVVVYKDGLVRRPKKAAILHVNNPDYPLKQIEKYKKKIQEDEIRSKTLDKDFRKRRGY